MNAWLSFVPPLADWSTNMFTELDPSKRFSLLVVLIGCATGVLCTFIVFLSATIMSIHNRRVDAAMKREMIERGMSADEISKIIESAAPPEDGTQRWIASWANKKK